MTGVYLGTFMPAEMALWKMYLSKITSLTSGCEIPGTAPDPHRASPVWMDTEKPTVILGNLLQISVTK